MKTMFLIMSMMSIAGATGILENRITTDMILTAHTFGATAETILMQINTPENTVEPITPFDRERLRNAGVPSAVIDALLYKAGQATEPQIDLQPDNAGLLDVVKLVQSGISEQIIAEQIHGNTLSSRPSVADLLYLKQNNVSELIISELMIAPVSKNIETSEVTFDGLVIRKFFKDRSGALVISDDKLTWRDSSNATKGFDLFINGVSRINLFYRVRDNGNFCYKVQFEFTKGNNYAFEDIQKDTGGNENLTRMVDYLKHKFADIPFVDKEKG